MIFLQKLVLGQNLQLAIGYFHRQYVVSQLLVVEQTISQLEMTTQFSLPKIYIYEKIAIHLVSFFLPGNLEVHFIQPPHVCQIPKLLDIR